MQLCEAAARPLQAAYHLKGFACGIDGTVVKFEEALGTYQRIRVLFSRTSGAARCTIPSTARFWAMTTALSTTSMLTGRGKQ
jgi:hypothetical protein